VKPGCIYYAFAQDLADANAFHLVEGWADEAAYEHHENAATFLQALVTVVKNVHILHREGVRYDVAQQHTDDPPGVPWYGLRTLYLRDRQAYRQRNRGFLVRGYSEWLRRFLFTSVDVNAHPGCKQPND
jgi:Uncharacterized conserved protein, COG1359